MIVHWVRLSAVGMMLAAVLLAAQDTTAATGPVYNGKIAYESWDINLGTDVWIMDPDGRNKTNVTNTSSAVEAQPAWSPDGARLAYVESYPGDTIYILDIASGQKTELPGLLSPFSPAWSPDGTKIAVSAYSSARAVGPDIYVLSVDGSELRQLTNTPEVYDRDPAWSPDGEKVAFSSGAEEFATDIYVMNSDGGERMKLTVDELANRSPSWSPDGDRIVFAKARARFDPGNTDLFVMDSDGSDAYQLTNSPFSSFMPAWSPDGRFVAYVELRYDPELLRLPVEGGTPLRLTGSDAHDLEPDWQATRAPAPVDNSFKLTATPASGAVGTEVRVQGEGCSEPGEQVSVKWEHIPADLEYTGQNKVGTTTADASGTFELTYTIPAELNWFMRGDLPVAPGNYVFFTANGICEAPFNLADLPTAGGPLGGGNGRPLITVGAALVVLGLSAMGASALQRRPRP